MIYRNWPTICHYSFCDVAVDVRVCPYVTHKAHVWYHVRSQEEVDGVDVGIKWRVEMVPKCIIHDLCKVVCAQVQQRPREPTYSSLDSPISVTTNVKQSVHGIVMIHSC